MDKLIVPKKINVGFQKRQGTYTGKLAYIIYWDDKGKLRKETSWNSWRHKEGQTYSEGYYDENDKWQRRQHKYGPEMAPQAFDNVPTEGFVLNKKAGGYSSGWNHRQTYCRVYDPRGFEFEIDIPNLLFILQECNAYKGKGLEGEFVYAWDGKNLALLPAHCKEYQDSLKYTELQTKKIGVKDLEPGCYYKTKKDEKELMYLGKFNYIDHSYGDKGIEKTHVFYDKSVEEGGYSWRHKFIGMSSMSTLGVKMNDTPVDEYASIMEEFNNSKYSGTIKELVSTKARVEFPGEDRYYWWRSNSDTKKMATHYLKIDDNTYRAVNIYVTRDYKRNENNYGGEYVYTYTLKSSKVYVLENGELFTRSRKFKDDNVYTEKQIREMGFLNVSYGLSGKKTKKAIA